MDGVDGRDTPVRAALLEGDGYNPWLERAADFGKACCQDDSREEGPHAEGWFSAIQKS